MARVYSTLLLSGDALALSVSAVVPAGVVWVVRDIAMYTGGTSGGQQAYVNDGYDGSPVFIVFVPATPAYNEWHGRQVFPAGRTLVARISDGSQLAVRVSGYVLELP